MMSGHLWLMVVLMTGRAVNSLFSCEKKPKVLAGVCERLLYVAWMDHKVRYRHGDFTRVTLGSRCDVLTD